MAKKITLEDPVFGSLVWDASDGAWVAAVTPEPFHSFGRDLPKIASEEEEEDADEAEGIEEDGAEDDPMLDAISSSTGFLNVMLSVPGISQEMAQMSEKDRELIGNAFAGLREKAEALDHPPLDQNKVLAEGKFVLLVMPAAKKEPPSDVQRDVWSAFMNDAKSVADKIMKRAFETYRRQRPVRLRWWEAYDDRPAKHLPEVKTPKGLAKLVRPMMFRVYPGGEIGIDFDGIWERGGGFGVLLRDNEIATLGPDKVATEYTGKWEKARRIDHPVFGDLRLDVMDEWVGHVRCDPFLNYYEIAEDRRKKSLFGEDLPSWAPEWLFLEGKFGLGIFTKAGLFGGAAGKPVPEPTPAQVEAFAAFKADEQKAVDTVVKGVFDYYNKVYKKYENKKDKTEPKVRSIKDLRELMTLQSINLLPESKGKSPAIVFNFSCSWDEEHGMSVLWREGKVRDVNISGEVFDEE